MIINATGTWGWVWLVAVVLLLVCLVSLLVYVVVHVTKLDDLVHLLNDDLTKAEAEIEVLKGRVGQANELKVRTAQTLPHAQVYGRHAHKG